MESQQPRPWRRYWARFIDYTLFLVVGGLPAIILLIALLPDNPLAIALGRGEPLSGFKFRLLWCVVWVFVEALLLSTFGTTPGKFLFNIQVRNEDERKLSYTQALRRGIGVWFFGQAFCFPPFQAIANWASYRRFTKQGRTKWDEAGNIQVTTYPMGKLKASLAVICIGLGVLMVLTTSR